MRIGILGGGQLALMLSEAALKLGHSVVVWDPSLDACARQLGMFINASFTDQDALSTFLDNVDVVTWEFENLPLEMVASIQKKCPLFPAFSLLEIKRDRLTEKDHLQSLNIPVTPFYAVDSISDIREFPVLLKTRRDGYDGKGHVLIETKSDLDQIQGDVVSGKYIAESIVNFEKEVSIVGTRDQSGNIVAYDLSDNVHTQGILRSLIVILGSEYYDQAYSYLSQLMTYHNYVGTLAIEFFVVQGQLIANECAPRVHNTGHWTIEGAMTSQFENHIRAITGMPLGDPLTQGFPAMVNVIGRHFQKSSQKIGMYYHDYNKAARPGRKLGHVTIMASTPSVRDPLLTFLY